MIFLNMSDNMASAQWLAVGGGALGACLRWGLCIALNASMFPMGTLIANLGGGLLMGMAMAYFLATPSIPKPAIPTPLQNELQLFIMTAF